MRVDFKKESPSGIDVEKLGDFPTISQEIMAFLQLLGAWAVFFSPPAENVWAIGPRIVADKLAWQRPGPVVLHDAEVADPQALQVASAAAYAFEYVGLPEGIYPIVEATLYCATAPKSNSAGAYFKAAQLIEEQGAKPEDIKHPV